MMLVIALVSQSYVSLCPPDQEPPPQEPLAVQAKQGFVLLVLLLLSLSSHSPGLILVDMALHESGPCIYTVY